VNGMRKLPWLALLLASLALALGTAACGGGGDDEGDGEPAAQETDTAAEEGGEPIRVGLVTDIGGLNDRGFNSLANQGLERAQEEFGVEGQVLESQSDADYIPNLSELGDEGYDLIVSVGFLMTDATAQAAPEYPESSFAIVDSAFDPPIENATGLLFKEQETGCLVGVVGALMSESGTISTVGGQKIPPVDRFIAGYQQCAQEARPDIQLLNAYSQDFVDQAKCKEIALDQIADGSDVVFQVAGGCGLGALDAAQERNVWGIGVDADQSHLGDHILTSALKRVDVAVFTTIEAVQNGTFEGGGVTTFGLAEDGVGLGEVSPEVPEDVMARVEEFEQRIIDGELQLAETVE
jgi:basic membrane protein A and related proteins